MGKRQEAKLETRRKIIEAVRELLNEKKAEDINIEEITTKAQIAKGSFYTHFKRKEDAISAIALSEYEVIKDFAANLSGSVYDQISYYLKQSVMIIEKNTLQVAQQWMKSVTAPLENEDTGTTKYHYDQEAIKEILMEAINSKELKDTLPVDIIINIIIDNYYGAVATWCINGGQERSLIASIENYCEYSLKPLIDIYKN